MKYATYYSSIERRTFTFDEIDILKALKAAVDASQFATGLPGEAQKDTWTMEINLLDDGDDYKPSATLTQTFEYGDKD